MVISTNPSDPHIRAIRLRQDLKPIADLVELCFASHMDDEGRDYIRHIRLTALNFSALILENTTPENSSLPFHGYVWEENGQIVGNLTLILLRKKARGTYFIANVAVHPDQRGKGIARQLTNRALRHVQEHQGKQIFLQVRNDNDIAVQLYNSHGFKEFSRRTTWIYRPKDPIPSGSVIDVKVTHRTKEDWAQQKNWLESNYPPEISWNMPFRLEKLAPTFMNWLNRIMNVEIQRSWAARKHGKLMGTITLERTSEVQDYLWVASSPVLEDETIQAILPIIQKRILFPQRMAINFPADRGRESFLKVGMVELNTLIWMDYKIEPEDS
ncbi:MAG: GNAT family N-acetyltransferase [Chloroflexi bacterium]|nr:GNAT family N-acetyltransferase [Chloroflexota bacterium]